MADFIKIGYGALIKQKVEEGSRMPNYKGDFKISYDRDEDDPIVLPIVGWEKEAKYGGKYISLACSLTPAKVEELGIDEIDDIAVKAITGE